MRKVDESRPARRQKMRVELKLSPAERAPRHGGIYTPLSSTWTTRFFAVRDFALSGFSTAGDWPAGGWCVAGFVAVATELFANGRRRKVFGAALDTLHMSDGAALPKWARPRFRLTLVSNGHLAVRQKKAHALGIDGLLDQVVYTAPTSGAENIGTRLPGASER